MKTLILILIGSKRNLLEDTYPMLIGLKTRNYDTIERFFVEEMKELSLGENNTFYSMFYKKGNERSF